MSRYTVVQVSDTHLSGTHAYFQDNWDAFVIEMVELRPDLVIHSGDVTFNAPDAPEDLVFARQQLDRLPCPWLAIPGNHDVGEPGENPRLGQPVNAERLGRWRTQFGDDWFCHDHGSWRFIGLDSELMGSGLPEEHDQLAFLDQCLGCAGDRQVGLILHKPVYVVEPDETNTLAHCVLPQARPQLLQRLTDGGIRFVASGHIHSHFAATKNGVEFVWCPTTAFIIPNKRMPVTDLNRCGYIRWDFNGQDFSYQMVEPPLFVNMEITNWTRSKGSSISLPPRLPRPA